MTSLHASALSYTLLIAALISSLLGVFVWINFFQHQWLGQLYAKELARENLVSGRLLYLHQMTDQRQVAFQLSDNEQDSCLVKSEPWGLYWLIHGVGKHSRTTAEASAIIGQAPYASRQSAMMLRTEKQSLVLVGKTYLEGDLFLPPGKLKSGFIGRKSYEGDSLHYQGKIMSSRDQLHKVDTQYMGTVRRIMQELHADTALPETYYVRNAKMDIGWQEETYTIKSQSTMILRNIELKGKCQLQSSADILVERSAVLEHTLLFARKIRIESGFKGNLQAFATEEIIVEPDVELFYPSVLMVAKPPDKSGKIYLEDNSRLEGCLLFTYDLLEGQEESSDYVKIAAGSEVWGEVFAPNNLEIRGSVNGHVNTGGFILKSPAAIYKNHLLDASIRYKARHPTYVSPMITKGAPFAILKEWKEPK